MGAEKLLSKEDFQAFQSGETVDLQEVRTQVEEAAAQLALGQTFMLNVLADHFEKHGGGQPSFAKKCLNEIKMCEIRQNLNFDKMIEIRKDFNHKMKNMKPKAKAKLLQQEKDNFILKAGNWFFKDTKFKLKFYSFIWCFQKTNKKVI